MSRALGAAAALLWLVLGLRWFDAAAGWRPRWLEAVPPALLALGLAAVLGLWLRARGARPHAEPLVPPGARSGLIVACLAAFAFRLPMVVQGAAGYVTPDGALSGIVALRLHAGLERLVFVPQVAYSGSLKSHLTAALMPALDPARAFALASVLFYVAFVAAVFLLGRAAAGGEHAEWTAAAAALYLAFAPAFLTRYSLSNDGNYVEVLALGTWAMVLALAWRAEEAGVGRALAIGLLLGLAFWSHVLAVIHAAAVVAWMLAVRTRPGLRALPALAGGFLLGAWPAVLWNAANGWETVRYLVPGGEGVEAGGQPLGARLWAVAAGQVPVLLGFDHGHAPAAAMLLRVAAGAVALLVVAAVVSAIRRRNAATSLLLALLGVNAAIALAALPVIPGNPRYLLFASAAVAVLLARMLAPPSRRWAMALVVAFGAVGSLAQMPGAVRADTQWRGFVAALEGEGVRHCHTDFYLATKINFISRERVVCSAKLGPTTTEYFVDYRARAEAATDAALVAVNTTNAEKLERRLERLGVSYERRDLMKPLLFRFSRPVDPALLFPDRDFPLR